MKELGHGMATTALGAGAQKHLLAEEIFDIVARRIIDGELEPGSRIRDIELATQLGVSRTPVREALQRLERLGMVKMYPSRYTEVSEITADIVEQSRVFAGLQAGVTAWLALPRLTPEQREQIAALVDQVDEALDDPRGANDARHELFVTLSALTANAQQQALAGDTQLALRRNLRFWTPSSDERAAMRAAGAGFRAAVLAGDAAEGDRLARAMHLV